MADSNEYVIKFDISNLPESDNATAGSKKTTTADNGGGDSMGIGDAYGTIKKATLGVVSYATAKSFADQIIGFNISQVSLETGASEYGQRLNMTYEIANGVFGAGVALVGGAVMGGPAGFALAAVGVAMNGIHKAISIAQRERELRTQANLENISIGMARVRSGITGSRSLNQ